MSATMNEDLVAPLESLVAPLEPLVAPLESLVPLPRKSTNEKRKADSISASSSAASSSAASSSAASSSDASPSAAKRLGALQGHKASLPDKFTNAIFAYIVAKSPSETGPSGTDPSANTHRIEIAHDSFSSETCGVKLIFSVDSMAEFLTYVKAYHEGNATPTSVYWPSKMVEELMRVVGDMLLDIRDEFTAKAVAKVVHVLASVVNTPVLPHPMNVIYSEAFIGMFTRVTKEWFSMEPTVREEVFTAYSSLLMGTCSTTKEYFDFVRRGASCFDEQFCAGVKSLSTSSYEELYAACTQAVVEKC